MTGRWPDEPARPTTTVSLAFGGLGDQLCLLAATRAWAERHSERRVLTTLLPELAAAYGDDVLRPVPRPEGEHRIVNAYWRARVRNRSPDRNYLGLYMAALGMEVEEPPRFQLPLLEPPSRLVAGGYVVVQPRAVTARNPDDLPTYVGRLVERVGVELPGWPIVAVGDPASTPRTIQGVDYSFLGSVTDLLRVVGHAGVILTPRSASAHVAAAYGVPTLVWVPGDGEDWHLDYPCWPHAQASVDDGEQAEHLLIGLLRDVRSGRAARGGTVALALSRAGLSSVRAWLGRSGLAPEQLDLSREVSMAEAVRTAARFATGLEPPDYLPYLLRGNAVEFVREEALAVCRGRGIDVGAGPWPLPGAEPIRDEPHRNALVLDHIADGTLDYVFSSHCLEHLREPAKALSLWARKLRPGGLLFLYLPHPDMRLWLAGSPHVPEHCWVPTPRLIHDMVSRSGLEVLRLTELPDVYWSFRCVARRRAT